MLPAGSVVPAHDTNHRHRAEPVPPGGPVPESKSRKKPSSPAAPVSTPSAAKPNPAWYKPVMFGLMILGLLWIITYYITQGQFPVPALGASNILVGFGIAIVGFLMTTRWR